MGTDDETNHKAMQYRKALDLGAALVGSVSGSVTGFAVGGPVGAVVGGALGPAIEMVLSEMLARAVTDRERARMGGLVIYAQERYAANIRDGLTPTGEFDVNGRGTKELLEGALNKAKASYQESKVRLLGNIYGNYPFVKKMPVDDAHLLLAIVEVLSYRQLAILAMISRGLPAGLRPRDYREGPRARMGVIAILQELYDLSQRGLVICQEANAESYDFLTAWHDIVPAHLRLAPLGDTFARIAQLDSVPAEDFREVAEALRES